MKSIKEKALISYYHTDDVKVYTTPGFFTVGNEIQGHIMTERELLMNLKISLICSYDISKYINLDSYDVYLDGTKFYILTERLKK